MPIMLNLEKSGLRRSACIRKMFRLFSIFSFCTAQVYTPSLPRPTILMTQAMAHMALVKTHFDETFNQMHTMVFAADQEQNENYTFRKILTQEDSNAFIQAMVK